MAADCGGRRAAAAATGSVGGRATPTGLREVATNGTPRSMPPRSEIIDSPEGHLGGIEDSVEPREGQRGLIASLKQKTTIAVTFSKRSTTDVLLVLTN